MRLAGNQCTRIHVVLYDRLDDLSVTIPPVPLGSGTLPAFPAQIQGPDAFLAFLEHMGVDGRLVIDGDLLGAFTVSHLPASPQQIVAALEARFAREDSVLSRLFQGEPATDEERTLSVPLVSFTLSSFSCEPDAAAGRAQAWAEAQAASSAKNSHG